MYRTGFAISIYIYIYIWSREMICSNQKKESREMIFLGEGDASAMIQM